MQRMESQLRKYNHQGRPGQAKVSTKKSSGIDLKTILIPKAKGKHRRSFTNQIEHDGQKHLVPFENSFHLKKESDGVNMGNYTRNMYEENYDFDSLGADESPARRGQDTPNTEQLAREGELEGVGRMSQNLEKMKRLLVKMGEQLGASQARTGKRPEDPKRRLHRMLTTIVNQLISERATRSGHTDTSPGDTYKTFIELESENCKSPESLVRQNPRGYHGFCHKDIIKSIVKLEELIESEDQGSLGEMGIITREKELINERVSEETSRENITSILAESCSRVRGFTGEMGLNKPFYQKSINDFDSYRRRSLQEAQQRLDRLIEKHLDNEDDERKIKKQRQKVQNWERRLARKESPKTHTTANLTSIQKSLTKFKKKQVSQRYILNTESQPGGAIKGDSLEELQKKVFTFDNHSSGKQMPRRSGPKIFEFIQSEGQIETPRDSLSRRKSQTVSETKSPEAVNIGRMHLVESQQSLPPVEGGESEADNVPKTEDQSRTGTNWSVVNNTTNISLRVLDSRQNMSMIHNINFWKQSDSSNHHQVPFNSIGPSGPNSKRKVKSRDISDKQSRRNRRSQVAVFRVLGQAVGDQPGAQPLESHAVVAHAPNQRFEGPKDEAELHAGAAQKSGWVGP